MKIVIDINDAIYKEILSGNDGWSNYVHGLVRTGTELKQGKWVYASETIAGTYHCSECGMVKKIKTNFCGRCGADMREPEGET